MQAAEEQRAAAEDQRRAMLVNLMQPAARDRRELVVCGSLRQLSLQNVQGMACRSANAAFQ